MRTECYEPDPGPVDATPEAFYAPTPADYAEYEEYLRSLLDEAPAEEEVEEYCQPRPEVVCPF